MKAITFELIKALLTIGIPLLLLFLKVCVEGSQKRRLKRDMQSLMLNAGESDDDADQDDQLRTAESWENEVSGEEVREMVLREIREEMWPHKKMVLEKEMHLGQSRSDFTFKLAERRVEELSAVAERVRRESAYSLRKRFIHAVQTLA